MTRRCERQNSYSAHLTEKWSWQKIAHYQEALNAALKKYAQRFPDDVCLATIAEELARGQAQLWLVLKNKTQFSAFAITKVERTHTGKKRVVLSDLAGEGGLELVKLIDKVEEWARTIHAEEMHMFGRSGWSKMLSHHGYSRNLIHYRKVLNP
ncbi:hypothetical protein AT246_07580 [Bartonella henselae]|uniref:Uncharacterized protein n=1 Tax=Bartonella henselae TaxID=38323 RepID=X5M0I7_BARHN|nr:hypothetical protein [Bartonella henselae]MDM9996897.1 hypothetical protein [Bartonella henselae]OLL50538.1 hypothetical protein AT247_05950 [Bartonella henselae]OLL51425.1 hypothetical protein AT241_00115 [Bartonella henselae]OLL52445.1 hypothetical protein AT243_04545 [Bartonella henselae]OLL53554.1 hypothetical protein AT240_02725 [Bartonella henselae]